MNKRMLTIVILTAVVLCGVVAFALTRNTAAPASNNNQTSDNNQNDATPQDSGNSSDSSSTDNVQYLLVYGNSGFIKPAIEVPSGATVTVRNDSDETLDFASDDHPTHTKQPALNIGDIAPGQSKTFTIKTPGTWGFHNHLNSSHTGQVIVK